MNLTYQIKLYFATLAIFLAIDLTWLGIVARGLYQKFLGGLLRPQTNWAAAVIFYLIFVLGILIFAVNPALQAGSMGKGLLLGALYGLFTYATYDLTNLATLKGWSVPITIIDMAWGTILSTCVAWISYMIGRWLA
jgi:uncharacterized membrane protein